MGERFEQISPEKELQVVNTFLIIYLISIIHEMHTETT